MTPRRQENHKQPMLFRRKLGTRGSSGQAARWLPRISTEVVDFPAAGEKRGGKIRDFSVVSNLIFRRLQGIWLENIFWKNGVAAGGHPWIAQYGWVLRRHGEQGKDGDELRESSIEISRSEFSFAEAASGPKPPAFAGIFMLDKQGFGV
jgi:hypothetical protein